MDSVEMNAALNNKNQKGLYTAGVFHTQLIKLRQYRGFKKQSQILDNLKIKRQTYSLWELGKRLPNVEQLQKIANFFNTDMNYFFLPDADPADYDLLKEE